MPEKKTAEKKEQSAEERALELSEAMDAQVAAAVLDPSTLVVGDPNDGGFVQEPGHGWSEDEMKIRAWTGADDEPHPGTAAPVAMDTGTKSTKS